MNSSLICDIKRFAVYDGDGIRTTVFFKGCPLKCLWCHNPESISPFPQLAYYAHKCIHCGECVQVCPQKAHSIENNIHVFHHDLCVDCGECEKVCLGDALKQYGKAYTVAELLPLLLEDRDFYTTPINDSSLTTGGVTLSGGECLIHADFCAKLLKELKREGIHTAVDTSGFVPRQTIDKVLPYTDIFLYDIKAIDDDVHITCTGCSNDIILDNLRYIDSCNKDIEIRIPYVPGYNSDQKEKILDLLKSLKNIVKIKVLPYHNYAGSKYTALHMENTLPGKLPTDEEIQSFQEQINALIKF